MDPIEQQQLVEAARRARYEWAVSVGACGRKTKKAQKGSSHLCM
jgi:hypothetical protein